MSMTFDNAALPLQLVLDGNEDHPHVDLVVNRDGQLPLAFETAKRWVPRLGSAAVVELAAALWRRGSRIMKFDVRDLRLNPIEAEDSERISEDLVDAITERGVAQAEQLLNSEYRDYLINSVEVLVGQRRASVARAGVVFAGNREQFLGVLREAWSEAGVG